MSGLAGGGRLRLVLATTNPGKVAELRDILAGLDLELLDGAEIQLPEVVEDGDTFIANARKKAIQCAAASGLPCVADDSGLEVDALDGEPGIHSARFALLTSASSPPEGISADRANLDLVLQRMDGCRDRRARFVCAAALALPGGTAEVVEAAIEGELLDAPRGDGGFGYDPIFRPLGHDRTTAEMSPAAKHSISHRGKAFRALRPRIAELVASASPPPGHSQI